MAAAGLVRVAAVVLALAGPAAAEVLRAADPEGVAGALRAEGFAADLARTRGGDPLIRAATPGELPFQLRFFGCLRGADCTSLQFVAGFAARRVPAETVNGWNAALRFGRVHVTEGGQPVLSWDLLLEPGGLSPELFAAQLALWERMMEGVLALLER